jgi:Ser/Thr protein kinase RdoA (MazF antagonist)
MRSTPPSTWRDDVDALLPGQLGAQARWMANLNARFPWRNVVGHIRLPDARDIVLKYHYTPADLYHEWAVARFLSDPSAPPLGPTCLGIHEQRMLLAFDYIAGVELTEVLDHDDADSVWDTAVRAVATLHLWAQSRWDAWLALWPTDQYASRVPDYDLPLDTLLAPFYTVGAVTPALTTAIAQARTVLAEPEGWLGFTHTDLQTRHLLWTAAGVQIIDWEGAGLHHRLYDLACLIDKPTGHGRQLPSAAHERAIAVYAETCGLDPLSVRHTLIPILTYERLIAIAEDHPTESARVRAALDGIISITRNDSAYASIGHAAGVLRETLPATELPTFAGFAQRTRMP